MSYTELKLNELILKPIKSKNKVPKTSKICSHLYQCYLYYRKTYL